MSTKTCLKFYLHCENEISFLFLEPNLAVFSSKCCNILYYLMMASSGKTLSNKF